MFHLEECTINDIKNAFQNKTLTSEELVMMYLQRIALIDQGEVKYNSVLEVNPDCLFEASLKDKERKNNKSKGLLHGIPVILKDNINTLGKMHTTAGSVALKNHFASYDAFIVKRLKEEGAIILGKANLTEFANFMAENMRNGYSSLGKEVLCPYNLKYDPSGSSAGSAVSVSINVTPLAIGTETGGSIMSPSQQNGIVGLKPTMGLVSRTGIVPISSTLDTAGPMAKTVTDCAYLLSVLRGNDELDPITLTKKDCKIDYTTTLNNIDKTKLRVGIVKNNYDKLSDKRKQAFDNVISKLNESGVTIIDDIELHETKNIYHVMLYEFKQAMNYYLSTLSNKLQIKTLKDIIKYNKKHAKEALKYGQKILEEAENNTSGKMTEKEYVEALEERREARIMLKQVFSKYQLDAIYFSSYTSLAPHTGYPSMTVPVGIDEENMPIGSYLLGNEFQEERLLQVGYTVEELMQGRINPLNITEK